jgi:hypothetical protein
LVKGGIRVPPLSAFRVIKAVVDTLISLAPDFSHRRMISSAMDRRQENRTILEAPLSYRLESSPRAFSLES